MWGQVWVAGCEPLPEGGTACPSIASPPLGASIMVLTAGALTGSTAGAAGQRRSVGKSSRAWSRSASTGRGSSRCRPRVPPGVNDVQDHHDPQAGGASSSSAFARGYTIEQADARHQERPQQEQDQGPQALRGQHHADRWRSSASTGTRPASSAVDLEPGTYFAARLQQDQARRGCSLSRSAASTPVPACRSDATLKAVDSTKWAKQARRDPAQGLAHVQEPRRPEPLRRHGEDEARQDAGRTSTTFLKKE